jgi:hypothetical protein
MSCDTPRTKRWERPNLEQNVMEETSKRHAKKNELLGRVTIKLLHHMTSSSAFNVN